MQQATVNLFADMGAQPATRADRPRRRHRRRPTRRSRRRRSPRPPASVADGAPVTLTGTATDAGGASSPASRSRPTTAPPGTRPTGHDELDLLVGRARRARRRRSRSRATDDSGNIADAGRRRARSTSPARARCGAPTHARPAPTPATPAPVEVGVKFTTDTFGTITGIRFYKAAANTGTHIGSLWTRRRPAARARRRSASESASGWQSVTLRQPGRRPAEHDVRRLLLRAERALLGDADYFYRDPVPRARTAARWPTAPPLHAVRNTGSDANGVYGYGAVEHVPDRPRTRRATTGST